MIAVVAGIITIFAFSHLVIGVYTTKITSNLSYTWIFLVIVSQSLLVIYGIINEAYGIYGPAIFLIASVIYILYVKVTYTGNQPVVDQNSLSL